MSTTGLLERPFGLCVLMARQCQMVAEMSIQARVAAVEASSMSMVGLDCHNQRPILTK
jgi:hypothetical protein